MPELQLDEINRVRLSRDSMVKWMEKPHFAEIICGLFCRVVARDKDSKKCYKVARVQGISDMQPAAKSATVTVTHGKTQKDYPLDFVSNGSFTEEEFTAYKQLLQQEGLPLITSAEVAKTIGEIKKFVRAAGPTPDAAAPAPAVGQKRPRAVAAVAGGEPKAKQPPIRGDTIEGMQRNLLELDKRLKQERHNVGIAETAIRAIKGATALTLKELREKQKRMTALGDQQAAVKATEKQIEEMRFALEQLQTELAEERARCDAHAKVVKAEHSAAEQRLVKIQEMEAVIAAQSEIIEQQQLIGESHEALAAVRETVRQRLREKNKHLSQVNAVYCKDEQRLRDEIAQLRAAAAEPAAGPSGRGNAEGQAGA